eukprot:scaffold11571_cov119-Isochrysis_galbana.AAC.2
MRSNRANRLSFRNAPSASASLTKCVRDAGKGGSMSRACRRPRRRHRRHVTLYIVCTTHTRTHACATLRLPLSPAAAARPRWCGLISDRDFTAASSSPAGRPSPLSLAADLRVSAASPPPAAPSRSRPPRLGPAGEPHAATTQSTHALRE